MSRSSKRTKRSKPNPKPAPAIPAQPRSTVTETVTWEHEGPLVDVEDFPVGIADERQMRLLMADWRRGRATRSIWDMVTDGYVALFSLAVVVAMMISGLLSVQNSSAGCNDLGCQTSRGMLPWLLTTGLVILALTIARLFGPVIASAAEGFWLLDTPMRRSRLLGGRFWAVILLSFTISVLISGLVLVIIGTSWTTCLVWAAGIGLGSAAATAFAAIIQATQRYLIFDIVRGLAALAGIVALGLTVGLHSGVFTALIRPELTAQLGYVLVGLSGVLFVALVFGARRLLDDLPRTRLVSGGDLLSGLQGAMFALDLNLMRDIVVGRRWLERGHVKPLRGRGTGVQALVWREVERLRRNPRALLVLLVSALIPYALLAIGMGAFGWTLTAIVLMFCLVPFLDALRVLTRTKGLARCFPLSTTQIRQAVVMVPAALAVAWGILASPAYLITGGVGFNTDTLLGGYARGLVTAIAGLIGAIRWVSARPADYSSPMVATGFGAMPPGLAMNLIRGFDVIALITLPLILGLNLWFSVGIAAICWLVLRSGGMSAEELMERNEEAKRELEEMKAAQAKEKIVIQRSQRR